MARRRIEILSARIWRALLLVAHGTEDKFISAERRVADGPANCPWQIRGDFRRGHALPIEAPKQTADALLICCNGRKILTPKKTHTQSSPSPSRPTERGLKFMSDELQEASHPCLEKFSRHILLAAIKRTAVLLEGMRPEVVGVFETAIERTETSSAQIQKFTAPKPIASAFDTQGPIAVVYPEGTWYHSCSPKFWNASSRNIYHGKSSKNWPLPGTKSFVVLKTRRHTGIRVRVEIPLGTAVKPPTIFRRKKFKRSGRTTTADFGGRKVPGISGVKPK